MAENNISVTNNMQAQMADIFRDTPIEAEKAGEYLSQFRMLMTYYRCAMKEVPCGTTVTLSARYKAG